MHTVLAAVSLSRAGEAAQVVGAMREHDALRATGAAAGEEDDVRVALVERGLVDRDRRRAGCGGVQHGVVIDVGTSQPSASSRCAPSAITRPRPRVARDALGFGGAVASVQRREHRAELRDRAEDRQRVERRSRPTTRCGRVWPTPMPRKHVRDLVRLRVERRRSR